MSLVSSLDGHTGWVTAIDPSSNDVHLASGSTDGTVRLWDVRGRACLHAAHAGGGTVWSVRFHPDGAQLAAGTESGGVSLFRWG